MSSEIGGHATESETTNHIINGLKVTSLDLCPKESEKTDSSDPNKSKGGLLKCSKPVEVVQDVVEIESNTSSENLVVSISNAEDLTGSICSNDLLELNSEFLSDHGFQDVSNEIEIQTQTPEVPTISEAVEDVKSENVDDMDIKVIEPQDTTDSVEIRNPQVAEKKIRRKRVSPPAPVTTTIYRTRTVVKADLAAQIEKDEKAQGIRSQSMSTPTSDKVPKAKTMKDVLASIPGFGAGKPRKRNSRKLSAAEQLEQTKEGCIDLETSGSILTQVNLRTILNKHTFALLPPLYQFKLLQLLPDVDTLTSPDNVSKPSSSAFNNEFFAKACKEWTSKLLAGDFTPEQRHKKRQEAEREKLKLDPWKVKYFEPIWGEKFVTPSTTTAPPKPPPTATPTSASSSQSSTQSSENCQSLRVPPLRSSARLSPSLPLQTSQSEMPDPAATSTSSSKVSMASKVENMNIDLQNDKEADSEGENDTVDIDIVAPCARSSDKVEEFSNKTLDLILGTAGDGQISTSSSAPEVCSPGKRSSSHLDTTNKPQVLVKKIKIIPPIAPSGEQVPYNIEVKIDEIQPATPIATSSTDPDFDDVDLAEEDSNFSETPIQLENTPVPSPQEYVTISETVEIEISSSPTNEVEIVDKCEPDLLAMDNEIELLEPISGTDVTEDDPNFIDYAKEQLEVEDLHVSVSNIESTPKLTSQEEEKGQRDNSAPETCRSESSASMRSSDSFMMEVDDSEAPTLQEEKAVEETSVEPPESVQVQEETIKTSKMSSEVSSALFSGQNAPVVKDEVTLPLPVESVADSVVDVTSVDVQIVEPKLSEPKPSSEPASTKSQSSKPIPIEVEEKPSLDPVRPGLEGSEVIKPIAVSPVPSVLHVIKKDVPADNRAVRTEPPAYPARRESQPQIIKILTVPATPGAIKIDPITKGNTISGVTFPMKFVSLNTTNTAITRQVQGSTSVRTTNCSPTSTTSTIIPVVLKVSNANSNTATVSLAKPSSFISETKSVPSPRPITPASPLTLSNIIPSRAHENIPIMSTTTTTTTANPNQQQQNTPPENVTTFVVNTLQNSPICTFNDNSSQSPKGFIIQQQIKTNPLHSLVQSVNSSTSLIGPTQGNITSINNNNKRNKKTKQVKMPRSTTAPPGSINLARSYQICQAVIQSSPNREQLQNQLVKPPPVLVTNKLDPTKLLHQQQQQQTQGNNSFGGDPQLVHLQRRASTPTVLQATQIQGSMPMLSGISSNQKVIVVSGGQGGNGPLTIQQQPHSTHAIHPQQNAHMVPLLRPIQPGSPLVVHSGNGRPSLQPHQLVVSSETSSSSNHMHFSGQGHSGIGMNVALGQNSHINSTTKNQNISNTQPQSMGTGTGSTTSSTIITSQQLAMLIQQQQQQMQHKQQLLNAQQQQQQRCQSIPVTLSQNQTPNSPGNVQLTNNTSIKTSNCGSVFICSPRPGQIPCSIPNNLNSVPHQIKLINSQFSQNSNSASSSPRPSMNLPTLQHQIVHIPIQRQQNNNPPHMMTNNNMNIGQMNFPLRAQIVTSNGETLTIHRASNALNESFTVRPSQRVSIGLPQGKQGGGVHQNYFISSESINPSVAASAISNFGNANSPTLIQNPSPGGNSQTPSNIIFSNPKVGSPGPNMVRSPLRIICRSPQDGGFQTQFVNNLGGNNGANSNQNSTTVNNNPISNLADFISNQLAASNIRPISPLAFEGNQKSQLSDSVNSNASSPDLFVEKQQMVPPGFGSSSNRAEKLNNVLCSSPSNIDPPTGVMVVSVVNKNELPYCTDQDNVDSLGRGNQGLSRENLFNCNNESLMDLQDAISVSMDSPYSLISEPDPPQISEIIEIPTTSSTGVTITGSTLPNFTATDSLNNIFVSSYSCMNADSSGPSECSRRTQLQIPSKSKELGNNMGTPYCIANNFNPPPPASTVPSVNLTSSINENHIGLNVPVNVSEVERSTVLVQTSNQSINDQQGADNSLGLTPLHQGQQQEGVRQQQYFIVQTTGSNGFPTSIAVPASILISPQVIMDQKGQSHSQHGLGIRSSSAPPVQHNHAANVGNIIVNNVNGHAPPGTIPISFSTPSSINLPAPTINSSRVGQIQTFHHIRGQLGEHINIGASKASPIPMELQDIRIIRKGPSGQQQHVTLNRGGPEFQQNQFTTSKANSIQSGQYCMTTGLIPVSHANQNFVPGHQVQLLSGGSPSFSITPVNSSNGQNQSSNVVEVQVSRASQPNTLGQVMTVGRRHVGNSNDVWSQVCGQTQQRQVVNVNLNGTNCSPRIITTTQPGQHPVISIPDTTQNGVNAAGTSGQDFDIFSAIAKVSEGLTIKMEQGGEEHSRGVLISTAMPETTNRNPAVERQEFHRLVEEDGQITLESGGNCVCDLRAMIMCRKCGAFCHDDCIGPADLCMTCIIR